MPKRSSPAMLNRSGFLRVQTANYSVGVAYEGAGATTVSRRRSPDAKTGRGPMAQYAVPEGVLIYLIQQSVDGSAERRLAAKFLLDCPRAQQTPKGIAERI